MLEVMDLKCSMDAFLYLLDFKSNIFNHLAGNKKKHAYFQRSTIVSFLMIPLNMANFL